MDYCGCLDAEMGRGTEPDWGREGCQEGWVDNQFDGDLRGVRPCCGCWCWCWCCGCWRWCWCSRCCCRFR